MISETKTDTQRIFLFLYGYKKTFFDKGDVVIITRIHRLVYLSIRCLRKKCFTLTMCCVVSKANQQNINSWWQCRDEKALE